MLAAYFVAFFISSSLVHGRVEALVVAPARGDGPKIKHLEHKNNNLQDQLNSFQQQVETLLERTESRGACFEDLESVNCTGSKSGSVGLVEALDELRVDGGWGQFSDWSECSATCGGGSQLRNRTCNNPSPQHWGKPCKGAAEDGRKCNVEPCCTEGFTRLNGQCLECVRENNIGYNGNNLATGRRYVKTAYAYECAKWCGVTEGCKFWTFVKSRKDCWLKHSSKGRRVNIDAISGTKGCAKDSPWEQTKTDDCWADCGKKGGPCPIFCGSKGYCCRRGYDGCPSGAGDASPNKHTCFTKISGVGVPVRTLSSSGYGNEWNSHFAIDG